MTSSPGYNILPTETFVEEALRLRKKYPNIKDDFYELQKQFKKDPNRQHSFRAGFV